MDKELFSPPPEVDSAILHIDVYEEPTFNVDIKKFFRLVRAGFAEKRKLLKNSLAGGLQMSKDEAEKAIKAAQLDKKPRAQELSMDDWKDLYDAIELSREL